MGAGGVGLAVLCEPRSHGGDERAGNRRTAFCGHLAGRLAQVRMDGPGGGAEGLGHEDAGGDPAAARVRTRSAGGLPGEGPFCARGLVKSGRSGYVLGHGAAVW